MINFLKNLFFRKPENSGVLLGPHNGASDPNVYVAGVASPIVYQKRLETGDWTFYAFDQEKQYSDPSSSGFSDSMSCVTHSLINSIEAQEFFITGKKVNYSKRWIAKMSGTTTQGNYLNKVADTIRECGLVLEEDYPAPKTPWTFDQYHADIPAVKMDELYRKGQEWKKKWNFQYEFLQVTDPNLDYHLKHAPIQVVIPGHAVCGVYSPDALMTYLDSYPSFIKRYQVSGLQAAMKGIITPTTILAREIGWQGSPELGVYIPADSMQRFEFIKQNIGNWLPGYSLDERIYTLPTKKPF